MGASPAAIRAGGAFVEIFLKDGLSKELRGTLNRVKQVGNVIVGWGARMMASGAAVATPIIAAAKAAASYGFEIEMASRRTGLGTSALSELGYAARVSGSSMEALELMTRRMQKTLTAASTGAKDSVKVFENLGLSASELSWMSTEKQLNAIMDAIGKLPSATERSAAAMQVFGRAGAQMLPMIQNAKELRERFAEMFGSVSEQEAQSLKDVAIVFMDLKESAMAVYRAIAEAVGPVLSDFRDWVVETAKAVRDWIRDNKEFMAGLLKAAAFVAALGAALLIVGKIIALVAAIVAAPWAALIVGVLSAIGYMVGFKNIVNWVGVAFKSLAFVVENFGDSVRIAVLASLRWMLKLAKALSPIAIAFNAISGGLLDEWEATLTEKIDEISSRMETAWNRKSRPQSNAKSAAERFAEAEQRYMGQVAAQWAKDLNRIASLELESVPASEMDALLKGRGFRSNTAGMRRTSLGTFNASAWLSLQGSNTDYARRTADATKRSADTLVKIRETIDENGWVAWAP